MQWKVSKLLGADQSAMAQLPFLINHITYVNNPARHTIQWVGFPSHTPGEERLRVAGEASKTKSREGQTLPPKGNSEEPYLCAVEGSPIPGSCPECNGQPQHLIKPDAGRILHVLLAVDGSSVAERHPLGDKKCKVSAAIVCLLPDTYLSNFSLPLCWSVPV